MRRSKLFRSKQIYHLFFLSFRRDAISRINQANTWPNAQKYPYSHLVSRIGLGSWNLFCSRRVESYEYSRNLKPIFTREQHNKLMCNRNRNISEIAFITQTCWHPLRRICYLHEVITFSGNNALDAFKKIPYPSNPKEASPVVKLRNIPPLLFMWSFSAQNPDWAPHCLIWHIIESRAVTNANNTNTISFGSKIVCVWKSVRRNISRRVKKDGNGDEREKGWESKWNITSNNELDQAPQMLVYQRKMKLKMLRKRVKSCVRILRTFGSLLFTDWRWKGK